MPLIVLSVLLAILVAAIFSWFTYHALKDASPRLAQAASWLIAICMTAGTLRIVSFLDKDLTQSHFERLYSPRIGRLRRVMQHADAWRRLPHRGVELNLLTTGAYTRVDAALLGRLPPGACVIVNPPPGMPPVSGIEQRFEPVELPHDVATLCELLRENLEHRYEMARERRPDDEQTPATESQRTQRRRFRFKWAWLSWLWFLVLGKRIWDAVAVGRYDWVFWVALIVGLLLLPLLTALVFVQQRWLIPGGIVITRRWQWNRLAQITRLTPRVSSLVIDVLPSSETQESNVCFNGPRAVIVALPFVAALGLLAGWLSTAEPPTEAQLQELTNPGSTS